MKKYLLTLELRYNDIKNGETESKDVTTTIGVYEDSEDAYKAGNEVCEFLESKYRLNTAWNRKERFSKNGAPFGRPNHLISNLAYLQTPFTFYFKITELKYNNVDEVVNEAEQAIKRYREHKKQQEY